MKTNRKAGISLIVLVITIIVMIILAATIILSINSSGIIEKANKAKTDADNATLLEAASVAYAEYDLAVNTGENVTGTAEEYVKNKLNGQGFTQEQLDNLVITNDGKITLKDEEETILAESIAITGETNVGVGSNIQLTAEVLPDNATNKTVTWTSSDESIATVDSNGKVTGLSSGNITITASIGDINTAYEIAVKNIITFKFIGTEYQALEGMKWREFIKSSYNSKAGFTIVDDMYVYRGSTTKVLTSSFVAVKADDVILDNHEYEYLV